MDIIEWAAQRSCASRQDLEDALKAAELEPSPQVMAFFVEMANLGLNLRVMGKALRNVLNAYEGGR